MSDVKSGDSTIANQLMKAAVIVNNAVLEDILSEMSLVGYSREVVQEGKTLLERAEALVQLRQKEFGDQIGATDALETEKAAVNKRYMRSLKLIRIHLADDSMAETTLGLKGRRKKSISGWSGQAKMLYNNLLNNDNWITELAAINITAETIQNELTAVDSVLDLYWTQQKEIGEAQEATIKRDEALDKLFDWTGRYKKIARIALEDSVQSLEKLGIVVKN